MQNCFFIHSINLLIVEILPIRGDFLILSYFRTVILYLILIFSIRLMGKRQIGQMEPSEFVVTMLVANLASIPMQDEGIPLFSGIVPILTVLGLELVLAVLSMWSMRFRKLLCGKPVILIENGKILQKNLRLTRVTLDELSGHLREKDILDPRTVQYAILETNGNLSVFPFAKHNPASAADAGIQVKNQQLPITLISDGKLMVENLKATGKTAAWVEKILQQYNTTVQDTFILTVDQKNKTIFYPKE